MTAEPLLFPAADVASPSPRLTWLSNHGLTVIKIGDRYQVWLTCDDCGKGDTEEEAIVDLCVKTGLKHYSQCP